MAKYTFHGLLFQFGQDPSQFLCRMGMGSGAVSGFRKRSTMMLYCKL